MVGYAPIQKGYKCFDPVSRKMFITMYVTFIEDKPFFENHLQGGRRHIKELVEDDIFCIVDQGPNFCIADTNLDQNFVDRGTDLIDFLEESLISINQKESFHNNIPEKSCLHQICQ